METSDEVTYEKIFNWIFIAVIDRVRRTDSIFGILHAKQPIRFFA